MTSHALYNRAHDEMLVQLAPFVCVVCRTIAAVACGCAKLCCAHVLTMFVLLAVSCVWLQPDGLLGQLHAANLLGALQVVIEAAVADVTSMVERQPDANLRVSGACMVECHCRC